MTDVQIEEWSGLSRPELVELLNRAGQESWVRNAPSPRTLVAFVDHVPVGFLSFIVQEIGPADRCPAIGQTEAKVVAFGVEEPMRNRGIGAELQRRLLERARELGCYQVRSRSDAEHVANHRLKLRLGFAVSPHVRTLEGGEERPGYFFVKVVN